MEQTAFKSVTFGGFDKQDVIQYIEKSARESAEIQEELRRENEELRKKLEALQDELLVAQTKLQAAEARCEETVARAAKTEQNSREELESLRVNADAYAKFQERLGNIECESLRRTAAQEEAVARQMKAVLDQFRAQYVDLMNTFQVASNHVTTELRRMEVAASQLPRAMDQVGTELDAMSAKMAQDLNQN